MYRNSSRFDREQAVLLFYLAANNKKFRNVFAELVIFLELDKLYDSVFIAVAGFFSIYIFIHLQA